MLIKWPDFYVTDTCEIDTSSAEALTTYLSDEIVGFQGSAPPELVMYPAFIPVMDDGNIGYHRGVVVDVFYPEGLAPYKIMAPICE